jgi:hypothetical protein
MEKRMDRTPSLAGEQAGLEEAVAALDAAWQAADPDERRRLLERALAPGAELVGPEPVGRRIGVPAIAALIGAFGERWPGARVVVTTRVDAHHGWARYGWAIRNARGESLLEGIDLVEAAEDGRLRRVVMFYGALTPLVAPE